MVKTVMVDLREMYTGDEETIIVPANVAEQVYVDWSQYETVGPGTWYVTRKSDHG